MGRRSFQIAARCTVPSTTSRRASRCALGCGQPACAEQWRRQHGSSEHPSMQRRFPAAFCRLPRRESDRRESASCACHQTAPAWPRCIGRLCCHGRRLSGGRLFLLACRFALAESDLVLRTFTNDPTAAWVPLGPIRDRRNPQYQHRMVRAIADLVSEGFYDSSLNSPKTRPDVTLPGAFPNPVTWLSTTGLLDVREIKRGQGRLASTLRAQCDSVLPVHRARWPNKRERRQREWH
jgi:hypothetical protein